MEKKTNPLFMKKLLFILVTIGLLASCKPFDPKLMQASDYSLSPKLPAMEKQIENNHIFLVTPQGTFIGLSPNDLSTIFDKEITQNITNPYTDKKGYIVLKINTIRDADRMRLGVVIPFMFLGFTTIKHFSDIEVQIDVLNSNRRLIGSYTGTGNCALKNSLYDGYQYLQKVTYLTAFRLALEQAKKKMSPDMDRLIKELN